MNGIDVDVLLEGLLALVGDVEAIGEDGILAEAAFSGKNGRIAFSAFTPKRGPSPDEIFTTNPDGTGERQRTPTTPRAFNSSPSYSPDGTKIAWERVVVGPNGPNLSRDDGDIWVMDADGTNKKRLTGSPADDFGPALSPDGRKVAFTRGYSGDRGTDIYVKKLKGGSARRVTNGGYHHEYEPVFSPDGGRIAFTRARFSSCCADVIVGGGEIATVRPDGTDFKVLTHTPDPAAAESPDFSPDGRKLVFDVFGATGQGSIQTIKADGTKRRTLFAPRRFRPSVPVFSPNGEKIAFDGYRNTTKDAYDIWTIDADGTNPTDVTPPSKRWESGPDWGPKPPSAK